MLRLAPAVYEQITAQAEHAYPEECCGILIGRLAPQHRTARSLSACVNAADDRKRRYAIAPEALIAAQRGARATGQQIVGFYHSHPDSAAQPSPTDHRLAYWPECSYFIVSVAHGKAASAASFTLREGQLVPEAHLVGDPEQNAASQVL